jgi:hypothetical protein
MAGTSATSSTKASNASPNKKLIVSRAAPLPGSSVVAAGLSCCHPDPERSRMGKDPEEFNSQSIVRTFRPTVFAVFHTRPKNKSQNAETFSSSKKVLLTNHEKPPNHHKLTIKEPSSNTRFSQNPQQKRTVPLRKKLQKTVT